MAARYILDTQVFLWAHIRPEKLSKTANKILSNAENRLYLSSISVWEIGTKHILHKLKLPENPEVFIPKVIAESGYAVLPFTLEHALKQSHLPWIHGDPFDRMLVAQSMQENIPLISSDSTIHEYAIKAIW